MNPDQISNQPKWYEAIKKKSAEIGFTMPSDIYIGTLLKSLTASKTYSNILELGTGVGVSLVWMIDGLDEHSTLTTIDNDPQLSKIAKTFFGNDPRVNIVCADGASWLKEYQGPTFDLIFADAWPGKYSELEEALALVKVGGFYIIDDMNPLPNWPDGHEEKMIQLTHYLESRNDFSLTKMDWSTGVILMVRKY